MCGVARNIFAGNGKETTAVEKGREQSTEEDNFKDGRRQCAIDYSDAT